MLTALYAYRAELAKAHSAVPGIVSPTLNVGLIKGGINTNVVPDQVTFRIDRRMIPEENPAQAEADLRRVIETAARARPDAKVDVHRLLLATPLTPIAGTDRLADAIARRAKQVLGVDVALTGVPLYTDARHYAAARYSDRAVWRGAALDPRSECAQRQREPAAQRSRGGHQDRRAGLRRSARCASVAVGLVNECAVHSVPSPLVGEGAERSEAGEGFAGAISLQSHPSPGSHLRYAAMFATLSRKGRGCRNARCGHRKTSRGSQRPTPERMA